MQAEITDGRIELKVRERASDSADRQRASSTRSLYPLINRRLRADNDAAAARIEHAF